MKKILIAGCILAGSLWATDYSGMTLDEMLSQKGSVAVEDREAFRAEMQSKMQDLTPEERSAIQGTKGSGQGQGNGQRKMLKDGTGGGNMYKGNGGGNRSMR